MSNSLSQILVSTNISGPILPCSVNNDATTALIPTETGLILKHNNCKENLHELRGETFATLKWIKVNQQLPESAHFYSVGFPLPDRVNITCQ